MAVMFRLEEDKTEEATQPTSLRQPRSGFPTSRSSQEVRRTSNVRIRRIAAGTIETRRVIVKAKARATEKGLGFRI